MRATRLLILLMVVVGHAAARRALLQGPLVGTGTPAVPAVPANATQLAGVPPAQPVQPAVAQPQAQQASVLAAQQQQQQAAALAAQQQQQQAAALAAKQQQQQAAALAAQKQQQQAAAFAAQKQQQQAAALAAQKQQQQAAALAAQKQQQQAQQQAAALAAQQKQQQQAAALAAQKQQQAQQAQQQAQQQALAAALQAKPVVAAAAQQPPKLSPPPVKAPGGSPPPQQAVKPAATATVAAALPVRSPPPPTKPVRSPPPAAKATALATISSSPDISGGSSASAGSSSFTGGGDSSFTGSSGSSFTGSSGTGSTGSATNAAMEAAAAGASPSIDLLSAGAPAFAPAPALDAAALLELPPFQPTADGSTECGFPQGEGAAGKQPPLTSGFADLPGDATEGTTDTATDEELLPYMARVFGPAANCSGVLIAPGYLLTSGWCMWRGEKALPEQVTVVVGGQAMAVAEVHVRAPVEGEPWRGFQQPKSNNTWDVALLKLATPASLARYATLPTWRSPKEGETVWATAWQAGSNTTVDYAELTVQPCPVEENEAYVAWTDGFCAGGNAVLEGACPEDKGAPLIMAVKDDNGTVVGDYVVGLTSGRMCEPTNATWSYYTDLSDKCILNQILDWILPRDTRAASPEPAPMGSPMLAPAPAPEMAAMRRLQDPATSPAAAVVPAELAAAAPAEASTGVDANFSQLMLRAVCYLFNTDPCPL
ncbi:hypothetical protein C2E21_5893 [Chlorella sorokiniana]|uniref:Peptidase S1 domain-containing protein n=1 Tax=Chlorella sorokiniana TaxID=3076 RepID=A0A2P6TMZ1_CHLSO|nr:hypothetical protein C2E21_5893 [Chlorella sorokiniana]|eukprot:PRW45704.1 hypothetical protein C2E21_5893 [Chlorella sorokiniana]